MILFYVLCGGVALLVYWGTAAVSWRWRIAISLIVFFALCGAATVVISMIGDKPAPGDRPYDPKEGILESDKKSTPRSQ
jgi:hypothetical protein